MKKKLTLSLILPCYNEAEHFLVSSKKILAALKHSRIPFEVIFVEDKSQDNTWELIQTFLKNHPKEKLHVLRHQENLGRGQSVTDGIRVAKGEVVGFMDIDCEVSPDFIPQFVMKVQAGFAVVCGHRTYRTSLSGILREATSKIYALMVRVLLGTRLSDTEAGYKFFNSKRILPILSQIQDKGWFWDTEVMVRSERAGLKIAFIPVKFERRSDKTSTVNLYADTVKYLKNLWRFRSELRNEVTKGAAIDTFWQQKSSAFTHQYRTIFGLPVTPVGLFLKIRFAKVSNLMSKLPGKIFLDVGCGSGVFMREAIGNGRYAIGVDYSEKMLAIAKNNLALISGSQYRLLKADAGQIPLPDNSIDLLLSSGLTDYLTLSQTGKFLDETSRLLRKNGSAILTFPKMTSPFAFLRRGFGLTLRKFFLQLPPQEAAFSEAEITALLTERNFRIHTWDQVMNTMYVVVAEKI